MALSEPLRSSGHPSGANPRPRFQRRLTFWSAFVIAIQSLARNATRSVLATLGIIIGVGCVITMMGLAQGTAVQMQERIRSMGANTLSINPAERRVGAVRMGRDSGTSLTLDDVAAIAARCPAVSRVSPRVQEDLRVKYGNKNDRVEILGVTNDYFPIRTFSVAQGRMFLDAEIEQRRRVCILGPAIAQTLFVRREPLGETVMIRGQQFLVIGITKPHGGSDTDWDERVWVPVTTAMERLTGAKANEIERIDVQAIDENHMKDAELQITAALRREHHLRDEQDNDFEIYNQQDRLDAAAESAQVLTALLAGIASVSLLVGGIGIMNIMLVSVTERTREIGIRRAVGARERDILVQFLIEALVMCALGASFGVALGMLSCWIGSVYAGWPVAITPQSMALSCGVAVSIGLFFGLYPAYRAAKLSPLNALRYD